MSSKELNVKRFISVFVAWPYANAPTLHIGHLVGALLPADIFARFHRKLGNNVIHVTGTDMHGTPVAVKAAKKGEPPEDFAKNNHSNFVNQLKQLNINFNLYINTHTKIHAKVTNNIGQYLYKKGFLFPKKTQMFYDKKAKKYLPDRYVEGTCPYCGYSPARGDQCDNCGRLLTPLELINPKSKLTGSTPIIKEVTNLYLDLPKMQKQLEILARKNKRLRPHVKEMTLGFLKEGLKPRPVTRNMHWGIPVEIPGYEDQVWYVWFEAVIGYLSAIITFFKIQNKLITQESQLIEKYEGMPIIFNNIQNTSNKRQSLSKLSWEDFWKGQKVYHYYFLGKDNIPFHTIIWPAQLLMYNFKYQDISDFNQFKLPEEITIKPLNLYYDVPANNFLNLNNDKISKSTGNYIGLDELLQKYTPTSIRYVFARLMPETKDSNFSMERFIELVNNELVATIGNLIYRTLSFAKKNYTCIDPVTIDPKVKSKIEQYYLQVQKYLSNVQLSKALEKILEFASLGNKFFNSTKPWKNPHSSRSKQAVFNSIVIVLNLINLLSPYLPQFSKLVASFIDLKEIEPLQTNPDTMPFKPIFVSKAFKIVKLEIPIHKLNN